MISIYNLTSSTFNKSKYMKYEFNFGFGRSIAIFMVLATMMYSSYGKITNFNGTLDGIRKKGLPFPLLALIFAIISQVMGILFVLAGEYRWFSKDKKTNKKIKNGGKVLLISFLVLTLWFYHNIFTMEGQNVNFLKNTGLIGGVMLI